jgi:hypothetical protein
MLKLTESEIEGARTEKGGFTRATLASWGVPWPPPAGWKQALLGGYAVPGTGGAATSKRPSECLESVLLRQVVMAVISAGRGDILSGLPELNSYYGCELPTVAEVIGGDYERAVVTGGISLDDKVYSFTCERRVDRG